ncbi:MAG: peptidylprolyl isomerase [Candidatus Puniceispirillales bacterium]
MNEKYEIEKSNYFIEEKREILQITTQDKDKASKFMSLINKGKNFNDLAKKYFELSKNDMNIGLLKKSDLPLDSADQIFKAKSNEVLGPIKTKFGLNIYKIINIAEKTEVNYDDAIKDIKEKMLKELSVEILFEN